MQRVAQRIEPRDVLALGLGELRVGPQPRRAQGLVQRTSCARATGAGSRWGGAGHDGSAAARTRVGGARGEALRRRAPRRSRLVWSADENAIFARRSSTRART